MKDYEELLKLRHDVLGEKSKYEENNTQPKTLTLQELVEKLTNKAMQLGSYLEALKFYMNEDIITEENAELLKETSFANGLENELYKNRYFYKKRGDIEPVNQDLF